MNQLILIELISLVSFIFSFMIIVMPYTTMANPMVIILWNILISYLIANMKMRKRPYLLAGLLFLLPAIKHHSVSDTIFLFIVSYYLFHYIHQYIGNHSSEFIKYRFQRKLYILAALIFIVNIFRLPTDSKYLFIIIIYFISTIILLRSMRHLEHDSNIEKIKNGNRIFIISISLISLILSIDKLKNSIFSAIKTTYFFIVDIIFKILYWPIFYLAYAWDKFLAYIMSSKKNNMDESLFSEVGNSMEDFRDLVQNNPALPSWLTRSISIATKLILILFIIYMIKKLFKSRVFNRIKEEKNYTEEREFIQIINRNKGDKRRLLKPKELKEQIRFYYKKYLIKIEKKGIVIENSDTSFDVNRKAKENFNRENIESLRNIYISIRYGEVYVNEDIVKEMKDIYKKV